MRPGGRLVLHVATDASRFRVRFHRWGGTGFTEMSVSAWLNGRPAPFGGPAHDWKWPSYGFEIPAAWPSGVYVAWLEAPGAPGLATSMDSAAALFVVRGSGRSRLLYKLPIATYQAYNCTGGGCFYLNPPWSSDPPGGRVTWRRPGGGIGGSTFGAPDHYDPSSPRQTFAHWDAPFISWLEREGHAVEYCTDLDVHAEPPLLERYSLLLSVGHDEYWTDAMRRAVEIHGARGGNVAFFGANVCWWRIHLVESDTAMVCHQGGPRGAMDHWWSGVGRPEDALTGVSYRHGGGWWGGAREPAGYVVQEGAHWAFAGTNLRTGDVFGRDSVPPLVGYECDGAPVEAIEDGTGRARLAADARRCGTPPDLRLLAVAPLSGRWDELPSREGQPAGAGLHNAAMALHAPRGTVFTTGTTDWAQVLAGGDRIVTQITRNVIDRLLQGPV